MITLKAHYGAAIEVAIGKAKATHKRETVNAPDGAEVYAYPHARGTEWGVNAEFRRLQPAARHSPAGRYRRACELSPQPQDQNQELKFCAAHAHAFCAKAPASSNAISGASCCTARAAASSGTCGLASLWLPSLR